MKHVYLLLIVRLLLSLQSSLADTTWVASGNVSGVWNSSGSPYVIHSGDIAVTTGETLLINPGVKVYFAGQFKLLVNGLLQAIGTETDSIWFTGSSANFPFDSPDRWRGIRFLDADEDCELSYCSISYGGAADTATGSFGGGVYCFSTNLRITHCLITRCHCGCNDTPGRGCGVFIDESNVEVENCRIDNNYPTDSFSGGNYQRGTGLAAHKSTVNMRHTAVKRNRSLWGAGGIYVMTGSTVTLDTCEVDSNAFYEVSMAALIDSGASLTATGTTISNNSYFSNGYSAGIVCYFGSIELEACTLNGNWGLYMNPVPFMGGGGLCTIEPAHALITDCVFQGNFAQFGGAANCRNTTLRNCDFIGNISTNGALYSNGGNLIEDCRFIGNEATLDIDRIAYYGDGYGGAIFFHAGTDTIRNCLFEGNVATYLTRGGFDYEDSLRSCQKGGALYCEADASPYVVNCAFFNNDMNQFESPGTGSVLYNFGGHPVLEYCTMDNNSASGGSYTFPDGWTVSEAGGVVYSVGGSVTLKSCIMSNSTATTGVWFANGATGNIQHSDFYGISGGSFLGTLPPGLGSISTTNANGDACDEFFNIYLDPEYVDVVNGDLHLANTSSCIGAGDPFSIVGIDYEYNTRPIPVASLRDMGAFESEIAGLLAAVDDLVIQPDYASDDVLLYWTASAGAVSYEVYVGNAPEYVPGLFTLLGTTASTSYTDTDGLLDTAPQRTYVVRASVLP